MNYENANTILPEHLVEELQKYIQGEYLYIPVKKDSGNNGANDPVTGKKLRSEIWTSQKNMLPGYHFGNWQMSIICRFIQFEK